MMDFENNGHTQLIYSIADDESNLQAHVVIDATVNGRCSGGLRMMPDFQSSVLSELAKLQTLKVGFLGVPVGGFKAWIVASPDDISVERKQELLKAFGKVLMPYFKSRLWLLGADMGITDEDIRFMLASIGMKTPRKVLTGSSGFYVGLTVFTAATRAARHIGLELDRCSLAVEGFGKVGSSVARVFSEKGVKVVAISTSEGAIYSEKGLDVEELIKLHHQVGNNVVKEYRGAEKIEKSKLLELDVNLLSPCASHHSINSENAGRIVARIICPGANIPITPKAKQILLSRGILCIPDFVANCGAIMGSGMESAGLSEKFIRGYVSQRFGDQVTGIMEGAEKEGLTYNEYAHRVATQRFLTAKERVEKGGIAIKTAYIAMWLYQKGLISPTLSGPLLQILARRFLR